MKANKIETVPLTKKEQALYNAVFPDWAAFDGKDYETRIGILGRMGQLAESLLKRKSKGIPRVRVEWFADPRLNAGGHGRSIKQLFERYGRSAKEIMCHPNFKDHLWYFIHGPDLPSGTIEGFRKIIEADVGSSNTVLMELCTFVRKEVRAKGLDRRHAAEEFCKLAHEIRKPEWADTVRSAALRANR